MNKRVTILALTFLLLAVFFAAAQHYRSREAPRTSRELTVYSDETVPEWTNSPVFEKDVFTFARIYYASDRSRMWGRRAGGWRTDDGVSDVNLSFRIQQVTSMKTDPNGRVLRITDPDLFDHPWIYIVEPGALVFLDEEIPVLQKYLLNGGFLMFDDFWGEDAWENVEQEMAKVFPERRFVELSLDHPLYNCVFPIKAKGQVPNYVTGHNSQYTGVTWEQEDAREVHHRVILDDKGRIMVIATHNTDNGDGWEREGRSEYYFREFAEKTSYPLGINIIFYTMTH